MRYQGRFTRCGINQSARSVVESWSAVRSNWNTQLGAPPAALLGKLPETVPGTIRGTMPADGLGRAQCRGAETAPLQCVLPVRAAIFCINMVSGVRVIAAELISMGVFRPRDSACTLCS